tara:strand:- start:295 stop:900 length:606 start_codon:yes stop_codon:yes gene_type:complete
MSKHNASVIASRVDIAAPRPIVLTSPEYTLLCGMLHRHSRRKEYMAWRDWNDRKKIWVRQTMKGDPPNVSRLFNPRYLEAYRTKLPVRVTLHEYDYFRKRAHVHYPYLVAMIGPKGGRFIVRGDLTESQKSERLAHAETNSAAPQNRCRQLDAVIASGEKQVITRPQYVYLRSVIAASPHYRETVVVESVNNVLVAYPKVT